jgi:hypothetical protein
MAAMGGTLPFESGGEKQHGAPGAIARDLRAGMTDVGPETDCSLHGE